MTYLLELLLDDGRGTD